MAAAAAAAALSSHILVIAALSSHILVILFLVASLLNPTICVQGVELEQTNKQIALFIFGDSLFDNGNNNYINTTPEFQANFWPYGETFFNHPTGRFSNGRLIPDFIAKYAKLPIAPPPYLKRGTTEFVNGANFASGGAGALDETHQGMVIGLKTQVASFKQVGKQLRHNLGEQEAKQLLSNSVYLLNIGGNDYFSTYGEKSSVFDKYTQQELVDMVISNITAAIKGIYAEGARKFGFLTLSPLGCWPSIREVNGDCSENVSAIVHLHNKAISNNIKKLEQQLEGFIYSKLDAYTLISERMNNPSKYGLEEGITACCGSGPYRGVDSCGGKRAVKEYELCSNPNVYLFFDSNHPTETVYQQLAMLMWSGNPSVTGPNNLKSLFEDTQLQKI